MHPSWHMSCVSMGFVVGVWLAPLLNVSAWVGVLGIVWAIASLVYTPRWMLIIGGVGALLVGLAHGSLAIGDLSPYGQLEGGVVTFRGMVREDPSLTSSGDLALQLKSIVVGEHDLSGTIFVTTRPTDSVVRGDIVTVRGVLDKGFGSFAASVRKAELERVVRPEPGDVGRRVRDWFAEEVRQEVRDPQASLGVGFLTGQKSALPEDLSESLRVVGLTHIVVASGYNLTIMVRLSRRLFVRVSKFLSAVSSAAMIISFVSVTGMSPSMTRAGLVSGLSLLTWYYGRAFHPLVLLPFAAMLTVAFEPSYVWGDLGWQLSFSAFAGVMVLAPLLQKYFFGDKQPGVLRQILGETISAHLVTLPIIAMQFGVVSNVAVFANLLVVPLVPLAMLLTFIVGLASIFSLPFVELIAHPTEWLLTYMTSVATYFSELSWAQLEAELAGWVWGVYISAIALVCIWMWRVTRHNFRQDNLVV